MANRTMRALILLLITVLLGILISGCTVAGLLVGARIDRRNAKAHRVSWDSVSSVPRGRAVQVTLTSGDTLCGRFTGLSALPAGRMFVMQTREQTRRIPLQHIQEVYAPPLHTRKWLLYGGVGLAVDAAIITAIGVAIEQSIPNIGTITI
jgi:hypothetical protein